MGSRFPRFSFKVYVDQTLRAAKDHPDLIVWPEAAAAFYFQPTDQYPPGLESDSQYRAATLELARKANTPILFGAPAFHIGNGQVNLFNRAYLVSADGKIVDFYDKIELAPFAEYVPARKLFGFFVNKIVVGLGEFAPGHRQTLFEVKGAKLAVLICYEGIFPDLSRRAVDQGANLVGQYHQRRLVWQTVPRPTSCWRCRRCARWRPTPRWCGWRIPESAP